VVFLRAIRFGMLSLACMSLAACTEPRVHEGRYLQAAPAPSQPLTTRIVFYPAAGQSPDQQNRDRYECYSWAAKQTGFDPSRDEFAARQRIEVVPAQPPGHDTTAGALIGAFLGAATSRPQQAAGGALFGAAAGAIVGAASDSARQGEAARMQQDYDTRAAQRQADLDRQAGNYRRAMTACLEGRGYRVE